MPPRRPKTDPPEDADATRARLLAAAAVVFGEQGYQFATVRDICTRAGVNIAAVNYHFRDKLGLYTEVLLQAVRRVEYQAVREAVAGIADPEEALRLFIRLMLDHMVTGTNFRLMAHE